MSVTNVIPRWELRGGSTDENGRRVLTRGWIVETDADSDSEAQVVDGLIAADATAALFASHPAYPKAVCRAIKPTPHKGPRTWQVIAEYSTAPFAAVGDGGASGIAGAGSGTTPATAAQSQDTPANQRPPTISIDEREIVEVHTQDAVDVDANGNPIPHVNTIGDPFDPPEEVPHSYHVITFRFFRSPSELNWNTRSQFLDSVNSDPVNVLGRIYDTDTLRCRKYSLETVWETGASGLELFFALTVVAEEDPKGWTVSTLNTGRRWAGAGSEIAAIVDENGQPVPDPVPLDADGIPIDGPPYHYVETNAYVPRTWNGTNGNLFGPGGLLG